MATATVAAAVAAGASGYPAQAGLAGTGSGSGLVSRTPAAGTPALVPTGPLQRVRQLVQCGGTMYAVGLFGSVVWNGRTYPRHNAFSFRATAPFTLSTWNPDVNGIVNSIAFRGTDCGEAYLGGLFSSVHGTAAANLAAVSTRTGAVLPGFGHSTNGEVETLAVARGHLLAGGYFGYVNGAHNPYFASLNPATGRDDGFVHLHLSGYLHYCNASRTKCTTGSRTYIYNQQVSHSGTLDLAEGDFTSAGGQPRQQIFMLNLATKPAQVTPWTSPQWDGSDGELPHGYPYQCYFDEGFYVRSAAWAPGDGTVYLATTGYHPWNLPKHDYPRTGLCDATSAWPTTQAKVTDKWIAYTGCYSLYSVAADADAVWVAGHPKYAYDPDGCKSAGPGAVADRGLLGLSAATGSPLLRSGGQAKYSMARANADDMLLTSAGLWIASSNRYGSQSCGPRGGHSGVCFLPYPS